MKSIQWLIQVGALIAVAVTSSSCRQRQEATHSGDNVAPHAEDVKGQDGTSMQKAKTGREPKPGGALPRIVTNMGEVEGNAISSLGVRVENQPLVIGAIENIWKEARKLKADGVKLLTFAVDKRVKIEPISDKHLRDIVDENWVELVAHRDADDVRLVIERQLASDFGKEFWVTLRKSEVNTTTNIARGVNESFVFEVERQESNLVLRKFTIDPSPGEASEYFYLEVPK